jgi:uncharacterized protein YjbI with pentapeptide repeats
MEGANLANCNLEKADLTSANLRDAYLAGANLEGASLQKADLEGADLQGANLQNADLSRANMEGASLEKAKLSGARLESAQLEQTNLGGATLVGADLTGVDLRDAYIGGAKFLQAKLRHARMDNVKLEEADLTEAIMVEADLRHAKGQGVNFCRAILERALLDNASLAEADFTEADLRGASMRNVSIRGAKMTGTMLAGIETSPETFEQVTADWVDFSSKTNRAKVEGAELVDYYRKLRSGDVPLAAPVPEQPAAPSEGPRKRHFGEGDVLRNAALEFGEKSVVEIESRFENCEIVLREGAQLTLGPSGTLADCSIQGAGEIVLQGVFVHENAKPSIIGPKRLIVRRTGSLTGCVQQHAQLTQFGLEKGCNLNLKIIRAS